MPMSRAKHGMLESIYLPPSPPTCGPPSLPISTLSPGIPGWFCVSASTTAHKSSSSHCLNRSRPGGLPSTNPPRASATMSSASRSARAGSSPTDQATGSTPGKFARHDREAHRQGSSGASDAVRFAMEDSRLGCQGKRASPLSLGPEAPS